MVQPLKFRPSSWKDICCSAWLWMWPSVRRSGADWLISMNDSVEAGSGIMIGPLPDMAGDSSIGAELGVHVARPI